MKLSELVAEIAGTQHFPQDPTITALCADSREVQPGSLFVAVPGQLIDGHRFVREALRRGAAALLLQADRAELEAQPKVPVVLAPDTRAALASIAAAFHRHPAGRLRVIGVTGTDGKTTTCHLINAVLEAGGRSTGLLGTVDFKVGQVWRSNETRMTTPGSPEVQALLAEMVAADVYYAILESTSHGLELRRLDQCQYDVAVYTNLSPDHLDQHGTFEAYRAAKGRLFEMLAGPSEKAGRRYAVLNLDDAECGYFRACCGAPVVSYGLSDEADVRGELLESGPMTTRLRVHAGGRTFSLALPMPGLFNVSNALAAVSVGLEEGIEPQVLTGALERFGGVPGRMERIDAGQPFGVVVDYAHTGEALRKVLATLRPGTLGKVITVFGSAGERGHTRRSGMAGAAAALADYTILTDEDPRSEDPMAIIDEMAAELGAKGQRESLDYSRILDRQEAIDAAIRRAAPGDVVLIAGKGHEQSIEVRGGKIPWDDRDAARRALAERGYPGGK